MSVSEKLLESVTPLMVYKCSFDKTGINYNVFLSTDDISTAAKEMLRKEYYLEDIDALDVSEGFLITYHYARFDSSERVAHRVMLTHDEPVIPTISDVYQGANWHERECADFHGINFSGHPNLIPLLLDPDTPQGVLLKDVKSRMPLRDLINPGESIFTTEGFTLFDEVQAEPEEPK
ncbi:NADH-quinone oxidoreductase subunit C [Maridesulfovibrio ferrireducens]|uniref:NADH-quinone oxidoreductase subunit C n=1 Tax=Maridesulfovibrio ferrireducens TaxID=246191 RepID=A0A1G9EHC0_9BACT|nr:NADH-quinone oxidoreductase subunit C [Maridesulfovibrio ferrireducens]SDK75540.1 NADH-quinone oxidoreductase subunit C [Maridesulfovibrio ferrireducens]